MKTIVLSEKEFKLLQGFIHQRCGIFFPASKKMLLYQRTRKRVAQLEQPFFWAYYRRLLQDPEEVQLLFDLISTQETSFFRAREHFEFLEQELLPSWQENSEAQTFRVWSCGCSTGQEPYSLAMLLLYCLGEVGPRSVKILATDLSRAAVQKARAGVWSAKLRHQIPKTLYERFMEDSPNSGQFQAKHRLKRPLEFRVHNLLHESDWLSEQQDVIFCRNVLMYFTQATRNQALERLLGKLKPGGYLFTGVAENILGFRLSLHLIRPGIYRLER